jgi:hypothetical protein
LDVRESKTAPARPAWGRSRFSDRLEIEAGAKRRKTGIVRITSTSSRFVADPLSVFWAVNEG